MTSCPPNYLLHVLLCGLGTAAGRIASNEILPYDSVASAAAVVQRGGTRFTVLTSRLVRMEQAMGSSPSPRFEERATLAVVNRNLKVPRFKASDSGGILTIVTDHIVLKYVLGRNFSASSLTVSCDFNLAGC